MLTSRPQSGNTSSPSRLRLVAAIVMIWAATTSIAHASGSNDSAQIFLWIAAMLVAGKLGTLVDRVRQPVVLGELMVGVVLGNLALAGLDWFEPIKSSFHVEFLAQLGAVILLFQIGLESEVGALFKVGVRSLWVAVVGVAAPFALGAYMVGPWLLPGLSEGAYLFLGAALTATSVGITGRVFRDMGVLSSREAQIVLGAAVIDDVLGLIILSVVSAIALSGAVSPSEIGWITLWAFGFLLAALVAGRYLAAPLSRLFAAIHSGPAMKVTIAFAICLVFAYVAHLVGLAPIVGAFAAGLILDEVNLDSFDDPGINSELADAVYGADSETKARVRAVVQTHSARHLEKMIEPVGHLLVPVFFVLAGMQVKLDLLLEPPILVLSLGLGVTAVLGKLVAGIVAGKVDRWLVGWGMVPRGEVGLIFAMVGKSLGVVTDELFSVIVLMVMFTTLAAPPVLAHLLRRNAHSKSIAATPERIADQPR